MKCNICRDELLFSRSHFRDDRAYEEYLWNIRNGKNYKMFKDLAVELHRLDCLDVDVIKDALHLFHKQMDERRAYRYEWYSANAERALELLSRDLNKQYEKTWCCWVLSEEEVTRAINGFAINTTHPTFGLEVSADDRKAFRDEFVERYKNALSIINDDWETTLRGCVKETIESWENNK